MPASKPWAPESRGPAASWLDEVRERGPAEVGRVLGLTHDERRNALSPCPSCGSEKRHPNRGDKRGALGLSRDGGGFRCFECGSSGDAVTLAALAVLGRAASSRDDWKDLRGFLAERGLCAPVSGSPSPKARRLPPPPPPTSSPPPRRLSTASVAETWARCVTVASDAPVAAWLRSRALPVDVVTERDLARALPADPPSWARFNGRLWTETGHRVLVPMYGAAGLVESLHARCVIPCAPGEKAASPSGAEVRGLVMADGPALRMLRGETRPDGVLVAEGVPDFLTWATHYRADAVRPVAVLGVIAGSWTEELAARVPDGMDVWIRTHADEAGHKYADRIAATLASRCHVARRRK